MARSFIYKIPLWLRISAVILVGVIIGAYLAGESTRKLDTIYLDQNMRDEYQNKTDIMANMLAEAIVTGDTQRAEKIISNATRVWKNMTYLHIQDERGVLVNEWPQDKIKFDWGTRKFESNINLGNVDYGVLSVYVDMNSFYTDMKNHINEIRARSGLILLVTGMFIIVLVNLMIIEKPEEEE